jgi:hypothetical protein
MAIAIGFGVAALFSAWLAACLLQSIVFGAVHSTKIRLE